MKTKSAAMPDLVGLTVTAWQQDVEELRVETKENRTFVWKHNQDCCENVEIDDVSGLPSDLIGLPLLVSELTVQEGEKNYDHETWSFYRFATERGWVVVRWYGTSNGYYSETVDMYEVVE